MGEETESTERKKRRQGERRKKQDEVERERERVRKRDESGRLLANSLLVNPCVYPVECSILPDDGSDKTYGFISKQLLDQTEPGQGHAAALHRPVFSAHI